MAASVGSWVSNSWILFSAAQPFSITNSATAGIAFRMIFIVFIPFNKFCKPHYTHKITKV